MPNSPERNVRYWLLLQVWARTPDPKWRQFFCADCKVGILVERAQDALPAPTVCPVHATGDCFRWNVRVPAHLQIPLFYGLNHWLALAALHNAQLRTYSLCWKHSFKRQGFLRHYRTLTRVVGHYWLQLFTCWNGIKGLTEACLVRMAHGKRECLWTRLPCMWELKCLLF